MRDGHGVRVVLSLGHEVGGNPAGVSARADYYQLAWPGNEIDATLAGHQLLRCGDITVPRPHYLVRTWNALGAESESSNSLGTTQAEDSFDTQHVRGHQDRRRRPR